MPGKLLQTDHLQPEQVGFLRLDTSSVRSNIMGGEFFGNTCRATAAIMDKKQVLYDKMAGYAVRFLFPVFQRSRAKIGVKIDMIDKKAWIYGQVECIARGEVFIHLRPEAG